MNQPGDSTLQEQRRSSGAAPPLPVHPVPHAVDADEHHGHNHSAFRKPSGRTHISTPSALEERETHLGQTVGNIAVENPVFSCRDVNVYYGHKHALKKVSIDVGRKQVLAMIGPSGCGKSTFLRCLNRMNDTI